MEDRMRGQYERAYALINLDHIEYNLKRIRERLSDRTRIMGMVKADGYGHGAVDIARMGEELDYVSGFGVATAEEGVILREGGIRKPVLVVGYTFPGSYEELILKHIDITVFKEDMLDQLSGTVAGLRQEKGIDLTARVHVKVDTGMGRIGILPDDSGISFIEKVLGRDGIELVGVFTHFAKADEGDETSMEGQYDQFCRFLDRIQKELGYDIPIKHCDNSAGAIRCGMHEMDAARIGIAMYGLWPLDIREEPGKELLKPGMELISRIIYLKEVAPGTEISYGGTYVTTRRAKVATVPLGYGDGYPRSLSNTGWVLVRGQRAPIIGRICMDQFMIDVTHIDDVKEGDLVTLIGKDGDETITVMELSELSGRFYYELVCGIGKRIPRVYTRNGNIVASKDYFHDF